MSKNVRYLTALAMLLALSIVLNEFLAFKTLNYKFSFGNIPLILTGIIFGPIIGGMLGLVVDIVSIMFNNSPYFVFNFFTVAKMMIGITPSLVFIVLRAHHNFTFTKAVMLVLVTAILSTTFNSLGMLSYLSFNAMIIGLPARITSLLIKTPFDAFIILKLYNLVGKKYLVTNR